jgi:hypothetical protein
MTKDPCGCNGHQGLEKQGSMAMGNHHSQILSSTQETFLCSSTHLVEEQLRPQQVH